MAACARRAADALRSCRLTSVRRQSERLFSSSLARHSAGSDGQPPRFVPPVKPVIADKTRTESATRRFLSPEFIPPRQRTNPVKFRMEREDMVRRRRVLHVPEFYVGSVLAVTLSDPHAAGGDKRFVGICIQRSGAGLGATFTLRNIIDGQGVEICYDLYSPLVRTIEVLKLEKRLDASLLYLRDALPEYSTFDLDMKPVHISPTQDVPVNQMKVKMKPRPWSKRWERPKYNVQGIRFDLYLTPEQMEHAQKWGQPWREYDMLIEYDTSTLEKEIYQEVQQELAK
ncbi:hypothetical protein P4O66_019912 [Electrophorus voltai]|uniref:Large ribosomal subunit protein bL19m n=2 Tax=Electrophorus TaxID=8004 RepID=A0AAY5F6B5_ELEEL|nr:39S ribosomal protein L19, mitochondrial [Electrophorus electricus]KAK1805634.1 hypothetical protein P4O66_019912 [Electrophorus voltai]